MTRYALIILLLCFYFAGRSQSIQNLSATFQSGKVIVTYDVIGAKSNQSFFLELYSSHNNFAQPLKQVSGDVGKSIAAGVGKRIVWDATTELTEFSGEVTFKVKGEMIPLPITFISPVTGGKARRGKSVSINWEGGKPDQTINFEVYKGNDRVTSIGDTKNSGQYYWRIPKNFSKGTYSIKLTSGTEAKQSGFFEVKARMPLLVKLLPLLAAGGAAVALSGGGGEKLSELPAAPNPN